MNIHNHSEWKIKFKMFVLAFILLFFSFFLFIALFDFVWFFFSANLLSDKNTHFLWNKTTGDSLKFVFISKKEATCLYFDFSCLLPNSFFFTVFIFIFTTAFVSKKSWIFIVFITSAWIKTNVKLFVKTIKTRKPKTLHRLTIP